MEMAICNGAASLSLLAELPTRKHLTMALNGHWFSATSNASLVLGLIAKLRLITCEGIEMIFNYTRKPCPRCTYPCHPIATRCSGCGFWFNLDWNKGDNVAPIPTGLMIGYLGDRARLIGKEVA